MENDPFGRDGQGQKEKESQNLRHPFNRSESTGISWGCLPERQDGDAEEEYQTLIEISSDGQSSDEDTGAVEGAERAKGADASQNVLELDSLRRKVRRVLGLSDSCIDLDSGHVADLGRHSDSGVLDDHSGRASKRKSVVDECLEEYLRKKLKNSKKKFGNVNENERSDALGISILEIARRRRGIRYAKGVDASGGASRDYLSRRLESPEKEGEHNVSGASTGKTDDRLKRVSADREFRGTSVYNSVKRSKNLKDSGSRAIVKDVAYGNPDVVDADGQCKESGVEKMKSLEINLHVETPKSSVGLVEEESGALLKSMAGQNLQEGSSMQIKSIKNSDCEYTTRITDLELSERPENVDVKNVVSRGEPSTRNKGKAKCAAKGSIYSEMDDFDFEFCDNLVQMLCEPREGSCTGLTGVLGQSFRVVEGLNKSPPAIKDQSTNEETGRGYQSPYPPPPSNGPPQDEPAVIAPSPPFVPVKPLNLLKLLKLITAYRADAESRVL